MIDFTEKPGDCWWSSNTSLIAGENSWQIFGHTHQQGKYKNFNNVTAQRRYDDKSNGNISAEHLYLPDFGRLEAVNTSIPSLRELTIANSVAPLLEKYYHGLVNTRNNGILSADEVGKIERRGYRRIGSNEENFARLARQPKLYLERVKKEMAGLDGAYIGYKYANVFVDEHIITSIHHAITVLENSTAAENPRAFITAAVLTGYVYNRVIHKARYMRPLDDYDIVRFRLVLLTVQRFGIDPEVGFEVRRHKDKCIWLQGVCLYLPTIDGHSLDVGEVEALMRKTPLLSSNSSSPSLVGH